MLPCKSDLIEVDWEQRGLDQSTYVEADGFQSSHVRDK